MASSTDSSFKLAYIKEDKTIGFVPILEKDKVPGYIAIGSAITSYARNFTIRAAQKNYYGVDKPGFIYADTDSIHCLKLSDDELNSIAHAFEGESFEKISTTEIVQKLIKISPKALLKLGKFI